MRTIVSLCILAIVSQIIVFRVECKSVPAWTPQNWTQLPTANDDDAVEVYYLVSPLLEEDFGDWLSYLNLYHGAIGFFNRNLNFSITINYDADDFFRNSMFPEIDEYPNGTRDLVWVNQGANFIYLGINWTYWIAGEWPVTTINGTTYNRYIAEWNSQINKTHPYYNMFSILKQWESDSWNPSWDCFDFVWASFTALSNLGAKFDSKVSLNRMYINAYSSQPPLDMTTLYYGDDSVRETIIDFYAFIQDSADESWEEWVFALIDTFDGIFYIRQSNRYMQIQLNFPYFGFDWEQAPLLQSNNQLMDHITIS